MRHRIQYLFITFILAYLFTSIGCMQEQAQRDSSAKMESNITSAIAVLHPTDGNDVSGTITFEKVEGGIKVAATVTGLTEGKHGFHIHEYGDCSAADGKSAGGHFNPTAMQHSAPTDSMRHVGDIGNIVADADGNATLEWVDSHMTFEGSNSIIGRGVIIHADEDDLTSQPTGAAGARVACGVIGIDKTE